MKKKVYKMTESDFHNLIRESVKKVLNNLNEDDFNDHELMNSNWSENGNSIYDDNLKRKQMQQDWEDSEFLDRRELEYFNTLQDDNYTKDYNRNVNNNWNKKDDLPF